jgi:hypothetical protein
MLTLAETIASNEKIINKQIIDWKRYERKQSAPNGRYYSSICLEELRTTIKTLS